MTRLMIGLGLVLIALSLKAETTTAGSPTNPLVEAYKAETERMRALAPLIESIANSRLKDAEAKYKLTQSEDIKKNIVYFQMLLNQLRQDMTYLNEFQNYINRANKNLLQDIIVLRNVRADGQFYMINGPSRLQPIQRLLGVINDCESLDVELQATLLKLKKVADLKNNISDDGLIVGYDEDAKTGLDAKQFVRRKLPSSPRLREKFPEIYESIDQPTVGFPGGSCRDLIEFAATENVNFKLNGRAHRILNACLNVIEIGAKNKMEQRVEEYVPTRTRILEYWVKVYPQLTQSSGAPVPPTPIVPNHP